MRQEVIIMPGLSTQASGLQSGIQFHPLLGEPLNLSGLQFHRNKGASQRCKHHDISHTGSTAE